jgi:ornithine carbamoyltransferase
MPLCKATLRAATAKAKPPPAAARLLFNPLVSKRSISIPSTAFSSPRHFLSIADLTPKELSTLVRQATKAKHAIKAGTVPASLQGTLAGKTIAMMFSKRSTRTRVSTEAAVVYMGGHPMFLGKDDIQLGVGAYTLSNTNFSMADVSGV